jgi:hypothetical protein
MNEPVGSAPASHVEAPHSGGAGRRARGPRALELVAMRGKDVVGVRHVRDGAAWVGNVADALARIPAREMREMGGQPLMVGEARAGAFVLHVPPRARARHHRDNGIPRLMMGPSRIELRDGERAVLVLGSMQIRAQVVPFETASGSSNLRSTLGLWLVVIGVIYAAGLAVSAAFAPPPPDRVEPGTMQRIHQRFLHGGDALP